MPGVVGDDQSGVVAVAAVGDDDGPPVTHGEGAPPGVGEENSATRALRARLEQELYALEALWRKTEEEFVRVFPSQNAVLTRCRCGWMMCLAEDFFLQKCCADSLSVC